jgi:hypothetical protein
VRGLNLFPLLIVAGGLVCVAGLFLILLLYPWKKKDDGGE